MRLLLPCLLLLISTVYSKKVIRQPQYHPDAKGMSDSFRDGFGQLTDILSFGLQESGGDDSLLKQGQNLMETVMRMIGIDADRIGAMAMNLVFYVAEWVSDNLMGSSGDVTRRSGASLMDWLATGDLSPVLDLWTHIQDPSLPQQMIETMIDRSGEDTACIQLLVCKLSPVVWASQRVLKRGVEARSFGQHLILQEFYQALPGRHDFNRFSSSCDGQYPACPMTSSNVAEL